MLLLFFCFTSSFPWGICHWFSVFFIPVLSCLWKFYNLYIKVTSRLCILLITIEGLWLVHISVEQSWMMLHYYSVFIRVLFLLVWCRWVILYLLHNLIMNTCAHVFSVIYCKWSGVHIWLLKALSSTTVKLIFRSFRILQLLEVNSSSTVSCILLYVIGRL